MMKVERLGVTCLFIDLRVDLAEMKDWEPERIKAFFEGLAQVNAAANPNNWDLPPLETTSD